MLSELLKSCVEACQKVLDNCQTVTDSCRASLLVCITACKECIKNPGACMVCWDECNEAADACRGSDGCEYHQACAIACVAAAEACRQQMYRSETDRVYRFVRLDAGKIDRKARTVPMSFSSEHPAMQRVEKLNPVTEAAGLDEGDVYIEVLDHTPENVDLSMLNNRGAFLDEHDDKDQLGVVESAEIDGKEKLGRAVVKMDNHEKAETRFSQMEANSRPHISAGYKYTRYLGEDTLPNGRKAKRFAWRALELSSVAVPADPTIGVARAYQDLPEVDSKKTPKATSPAKTEPESKNMPEPVVIDETKVRSEERTTTLTTERKRMEEITKIADALIKDHGKKNGGEMTDQIRTMANEALTRGESIGDFQIRAMQEVIKAKPATPVLIADCTDDPTQYSILRGIQSCIKRGSRIPDGLEGEVHQEVERKAKVQGGLGYEAEGFQVPADAKLRLGRSRAERMVRDMQATIFGQGGAFVPTQLVVPVIELLRNRMVLDLVGKRTMAGLQGNIVIPRQEAAGTAFSVGEIGLLTDTAQVLGQISLTPKRVGATQTYSKQFVMQSSPDAEAFMRDDLLKVIALQWDRLGLNGQGAADEPLGIMNTPGISSVVFGATPTYIKIVSFETAIRAANVIDDLAYLSTPTVKGALKTVAEALTGATTIGGAANALWKGNGMDGTMNGYPAHDSNQIPNNKVLMGAFTHLIHAIWGGIDVVVDTFTKAKNAETVLTFNTWGDFALRHPEAFCVSADAGNQ